MILPTDRNVWINVRSVVGSVPASYAVGVTAEAIANRSYPGTTMSKARLHLIRCSDEIEPQTRARRRERGVQLSIIDGGRAGGVERGNPWDAVFGLFDVAVLVAHANCETLIAASLTIFELQGWAGPEQIN
jgi:hypothetical protein